MEILTEFLNWYLMLMFKIFIWMIVFSFLVGILLGLIGILLGWGERYLRERAYLSAASKQDNNDTGLVPPSSSDSGDNQVWLTGKDDYGINMEGMNGYPGGYGDEQMFEDEEEFHGMDYGLLDDEAKDENNEL
jgi:hypothetical protein